MRASSCPGVKPTQRRFGVSERQTRLGELIGMKEEGGNEHITLASKEGRKQTGRWWGRLSSQVVKDDGK